jgi:flagellar hook-basal body complex protein FliE
MNVSGVSGSVAQVNWAAAAGKQGLSGGDTGFSSLLEGALQKVDDAQTTANQKVSDMMAGKGDVHEAMISVEKASLSFDLMMQVRNKVVSAYQEIERLQF